jgi:hypothetical protein
VKNRILIVLIVFLNRLLFAQSMPTVIVEPFAINGLPPLQSYVYGKLNGKWIVMGGRTDGLHRRQPFAAFDAAGNNTNIYVVDPVGNQIWSASIATLPQALKEQLQSANMEFYQTDTMLYLVGGYGYSTTAGDHVTYPNLIAVDLAGLTTAIINGTSISSYFRQISHQFLAVTGGHLGKLGNTYYLAVGNRFDGRYNPMGNPTYVQRYTNAIRKFTINDNGVSLTIANLDSMTDALQLHRRDYNMVPQVFSGGNLGYTIFSGVFQATADLPFLNSVDFDANSHNPNNNFNQYLNHYHCPNFGAYDSSENLMHSFFFGGISQYYVDNNGVQIQDNNVPFVKTIARVTRDANGNMVETKLNVEMPALLGSGAELILADQLPLYANDAVKQNQLLSDTAFIGYIYGGISSSAPNIFFTNTGVESSASANVFRVYLIQQSLITGISVPAKENFNLRVLPNPAVNGKIVFECDGKIESTATVHLQNMQGQILKSQSLNEIKRKSDNRFEMNMDLPAGNYLIAVTSGQFLKTLKIAVQ